MRAKQSQNPMKAASPVVASPREGWVLQRSCACASSSLAGGCDACNEQLSTLQRKAISDQAGNFSVPLIVNDVLRSVDEAWDRTTRDFFEPHPAHNFGTLPVRANVPPKVQAKLTISQ